MDRFLYVLSERFPRVSQAIVELVPLNIRMATRNAATLTEESANEMRAFLALIPDEQTERVSDAVVKFMRVVFPALNALIDDVGLDVIVTVTHALTMSRAQAKA